MAGIIFLLYRQQFDQKTAFSKESTGEHQVKGKITIVGQSGDSCRSSPSKLKLATGAAAVMSWEGMPQALRLGSTGRPLRRRILVVSDNLLFRFWVGFGFCVYDRRYLRSRCFVLGPESFGDLGFGQDKFPDFFYLLVQVRVFPAHFAFLDVLIC
ncbi:MAG: hypothetical protein JRF04_04025 [Deltaproteobacteria bacterium]|nr:hypothetical protein [Deltaproteobacteria bacterium]